MLEFKRIDANTKRPNMTRGLALVVLLCDRYGKPGYRLGKLEAQKLAYFLQVAGEPLRLAYKKYHYGPYADNLNHVLQHIDGHYIKGYGDRNQRSEMYVLPEGRQQAEAFLDSHTDAHSRLEQVAQLIEGFETPYGMEMLATLHWVATQDNPNAAVDVEVAIQEVYEWSDRKRNLFKPSHLRKAWQRLQEQGWFSPPT